MPTAIANPRELRQQRSDLLEQADALVDAAEAENRDFTAEEDQQYDDLMSQADALLARAERLEARSQRQPAQRQPVRRMAAGGGRAPAVVRQLGDDETRAIAHYIRTGDASGLGELRAEGEGQTPWGVALTLPTPAEMRAANDTTMNITTDADGKYTVPVGLASTIAARVNERALYNLLGCQRIPGVGTTVNHAFENANPEPFATTSEQADDHSNNYERDAPVFGLKAFTLVKKSKKLELTEELLEDNDVNLMAFVSDSISRSMANTMNSMLLTEAGANGTQYKLFASNNGIAFGEVDDLVYNDTLGYYLDDGSNAAWVMRPTTYGKVAKITGDARSYAETPAGSSMPRRSLLGYPAYYSNNAAAVTTSAKSIFFGDWSYMGYRLGPDLRLIQDPYSVDGMLVLKYSFRAVFGVLIAGAIGYGQHPTTTT